MLDRSRPILFLVQVVAILFLVSASLFGTLSVSEAVAYPLVAVFLVWSTVALVRGRPDLRFVSRAMFGVGGTVWVGLLAFRLFAPLEAPPAGQRLTPDLFLVFVALSVIAFAALATRDAVRVSLALFATIVVISLAWMVPSVLAGDELVAVGRLSVYLALYGAIVLMLTALSRKNDDHAKTTLEAARFHALAYVDPVTGLPNRRRLEERLKKATVMAERYGTELAVLLVDIDRFKFVNDTYGHDVGDRVLQVFGDVVQSELRASDDFGRWGGEEFVVLAPHTDGHEAVELAERIRRRVAEHDFPSGVRITSSFGVATHVEAASAGDLIRRADERLYAAKEAGRDRVVGSGPHDAIA